MASCFFIGHRDTPNTLLPVLQEIIEQHIFEYHVTDFIVGHYGNFDCLAARAVISIKPKYPTISLSLLLPYHPSERPIELPIGFDNTYYPENIEHVPKKFAIVRANQYTIQSVDYLIAYVQHPASNAYNLLNYARRRELRGEISICNIANI